MPAHFRLIAIIATVNPSAIRSILEGLLGPSATIEEWGSEESRPGQRAEFRVQANLKGASAKELNTSLLSAIRKADNETTLKTSWSSGGVTERYVDYIQKKSA